LTQTQAAHLHGISLEEAFTQYQKAFNQKPFLKSVYHEWFDFIISRLIPGKTLEIGAGNGSFKTYYPEVISSDVAKAPWIDIVADATEMPFGNGELDNIVAIDVLHHIAEPASFFREAHRVLRPGGRVVLVEPYISPFSYVIRKLFHHEPIDMKRISLFDKATKHAMDANIAIPTLIFCSPNPEYRNLYQGFRLSHVSIGELLSYQLVGGITRKPLMPDPVLRMIRSMEKKLAFLNPLMAFKMFCVLEKDEFPAQSLN
jgi:SAM-dependent methyltransferase